jgi:UDP-N-acetylmuramate dehydrogenase
MVDEIWFPESFKELKELAINYPTVPVISYGTNILFTPKIKNLINLTYLPQEIHIEESSDNIYFYLSTNTPLSTLVQLTIDHNVTGFEGLFGIPGSISGAIYGNSGSGNCCVSDYLYAVSCLNHSGYINRYNIKDLKFSRRYSSLQDINEIITHAEFIFPKQKTNKSKLEEAKNHRKNFPHYPSIGGWYKNWHSLKPYQNELIGLKHNDAEVSEMINIIINKGNATFEDMIALDLKIKDIVKGSLEMEIKII